MAMSVKFACVLLRAEAEHYRAQGLPAEARALYLRFLHSHPALPQTIREGIERELRRIAHEIDDHESDESLSLSDETLAVIRKGWSAGATRDELLTTAMALFRVGRLEEALAELDPLVRHCPRRVEHRPCPGPVEGAALQSDVPPGRSGVPKPNRSVR